MRRADRRRPDPPASRGAASRTVGILIRCRPMRRRLFSLASLLSLLLCVATVALWVRSYRHLDQLMRRVPDLTKSSGHLRITTWRGSLFFSLASLSGEIAIYDVTPQVDGYRQLTPNWRYSWANRGDSRPFVPMAMRQGFGRDEHVVWDMEPPPVIKLRGERVKVTGRAGTETTLAMPLATFVVLFAALPTVSLVAWGRRARRVRKGACPACSYNLTGNTSGVCPECGTAVPAKAEARA